MMKLKKEEIAYINSVINPHPSIKTISIEEERNLIKIIQTEKNQDKVMAATEKLIFSHQNVIIKMASGHHSKKNYIPLMELINCGNAGLMESIYAFDLDKANGFLAYALYRAHLRMLELVYEYEHTMTIPRGMNECRHKYGKLKEENKSDNEICECLKITPQKLKQIEVLMQPSAVSLESKVDKSGKLALKDVIENENTKNPCVELMGKEIKLAFNIAFSILDDKEKDILKMRYMSDDSYTLKDIGKKYNCSGELIRLKEIKALQKMKKHLHKNGYRHEYMH